jgi:Icc protein
MAKLAHLSDLHIGRSAHTETVAWRLSRLLQKDDTVHVVVTGDVTHRGRYRDLARFTDIFDVFHRQGRLTVIPGNHDMNREGAGHWIMEETVDALVKPGLYLVRLNTTSPHNRFVISSHGTLTEKMIEEVDRKLSEAPPGHLRVLLLHHHLLPLPTENIAEWFARFGWPNPQELKLGEQLLNRVVAKCDLILHGHRHIPRETLYKEPSSGMVLPLYNAGSSTELGKFRVFTHKDGKVLNVKWLG